MRPPIMKFIHTADWHLGNTFHGHSRTDEHQHFLQWLLQTLQERQPDALLVTGDVFDTPNPSAEAENLFFDFLHHATEAVEGLQIVVVAGNHDSGGRLDAPDALLKERGVYVRGLVRRTDSGAPDYDEHILPLSTRTDPEARIVVFALPFLRSNDYAAGTSMQEALRAYIDNMYKQLRKSAFKGLPVVVCAHFYAQGAEVNEVEHSERLVVGGQDLVEADVVSRGASYVALGHIHKAQQVDDVTWYAGSVLPMSFAEKFYQHGVNEVEISDEGDASVSQIPYAPLRTLISIPGRGAALAGEVLDALATLPKRKKDDDGSDWPYLEIRVRETQPEPGLLRDVTAALQDRAVRFCRMVREREVQPADKVQARNLQELQSITPDDLLRRVFRSRYGEELPDEMATRFQQASEAAAE